MNSIGDITSLLSQTAENIRIKLDEASKTLNKIPDILTYTQNGRNIDTIPKINQNNFRLYLGQIFTNNKGLYSDDFIIGSIKSYLKHLEDGKILVIESASEVSWNINGLKNKDCALSPDKQIDYLNAIIEKYFPKYKNKILVEKISNNHIELLLSIENNGIDELNSENKDGESSSLKAAKVLFKACQKNNKLFTKIASTNANKKKGEKFNKADKKNYYALVEIAIRLTDYINGIYIQGGESRQKMYDNIILDILNGGYDNIKEIKELIVSINNPKQSFSSLNFNKNKYKQELERKIKSKKFWKKTTLISLSISITISSIISGYKYREYEEEKNVDKRIENALLKQSKKTKNFRNTGDSWMITAHEFQYNSPEKKKNIILYFSKTAAYEFYDRYYEGQNIDINIIEAMIATELARGDFLQKNSNFEFQGWYNKLIEKEFIPNNSTTLASMGFNIEYKLGKFEKFRKAFQNTKNINISDLDIKISVASKIGKISINGGIEYELGIISINGGIEYELGIIKCGISSITPSSVGVQNCNSIFYGKTFLVAKHSNSKLGYNLIEGKKISEYMFK